MQYRTNGSYLCAICASALVIVVTLLYVVAENLGTWNVALTDKKLPLLLLIVYAIVIKYINSRDNVLFCKLFNTIQVVFVGCNVALEDIIDTLDIEAKSEVAYFLSLLCACDMTVAPDENELIRRLIV